MCGQFSIKIDGEFYPRYEIEQELELKPNHNVFPFSFIPVVVKRSPKKVIQMKWGFIPSWAREFNPKFASINTRAETINQKPYFKSAFQNSRCLIPATGFYEWKKEGDKKIPYYFHMKDSSYFSFAGIFSIWKDAEDKEFYTCSIITTKPNAIMKNIHDRMPVILSREEEEIWIDKSVKDEELLKQLLNPYPSDEILVAKQSP